VDLLSLVGAVGQGKCDRQNSGLCRLADMFTWAFTGLSKIYFDFLDISNGPGV